MFISGLALMSVLSGTLGNERVHCKKFGTSQNRNILTDFL